MEGHSPAGQANGCNGVDAQLNDDLRSAACCIESAYSVPSVCWQCGREPLSGAKPRPEQTVIDAENRSGAGNPPRASRSSALVSAAAAGARIRYEQREQAQRRL